MMGISIASLATSALLTGMSASPLADVFVDQSAANCSAGTGTALDPVCSIGAALTLAAPGDTVRIAPGTYFENLSLNLDIELLGTAGDELTIVDGSAAGSVVVVGSAVTVIIDGLTLANGVAPMGAGILSRGELTLKNSTVTGNRTSGYGGGGAGIWVPSQGGDLTIENSTISYNNAANNDYYVFGGGVLISNSNASIKGSTISDNRCHSTSPLSKHYSYGGGISVTGGSLVVEDSTIAANSTTDTGGGIFCNSSVIQISNSTISGNRVTYNSGGAAMLIRPVAGSRITNTTVTGNSAHSRLGGMWIISPGTIDLGNSIIAGNTSTLDPPDAGGQFVSLGNNLIGAAGGVLIHGVNGDLEGTPSNPIDALLGPLRDNGGSTATHALLLGSPAIDAGNPLSFAPFDQRGIPRPSGAAPDMGAVEFDGSASSWCNGDGGDQQGCTNCLCGNNAAPGTIGGCLNSAGTPARLLVSGDPSVSLPPLSSNDLRFGLEGARGRVLTLLTSGDAIASQNMANPCFGLNSGVRFIGFDGLRCAIFGVRRHGARTSDANGNVGGTSPPWGGEGGPPIGLALAFGGFASGQTRFFQTIYRDEPTLVCMTGLNSTQAIEVAFTP